VTATISLVAESHPEGILVAAAQLTTSIALLEAQLAAQRKARAQLGSDWHGDAARAALVGCERNLQRQLRLQVRFEALQSALNSGGAQLSSLRTHILGAAVQATALGGAVSDGGSVRATRMGLAMSPPLAAAYSLLLKKLLDTFDAVDRATDLALNTVGVPQAPPHTSAPRIPDKGTDPRQVKGWWESLSPEEQQRLADDEPDQIGSLNGIPVAIRDYANRKVMKQDLEPVRRAASGAGVPPETVLATTTPKASRAASNSTVRRAPTTSRRTRSFCTPTSRRSSAVKGGRRLRPVIPTRPTTPRSWSPAPAPASVTGISRGRTASTCTTRRRVQRR
jgi:hypothetical protein